MAGIPIVIRASENAAYLARQIEAKTTAKKTYKINHKSSNINRGLVARKDFRIIIIWLCVCIDLMEV
jgi:hypothetical protein